MCVPVGCQYVSIPVGCQYVSIPVCCQYMFGLEDTNVGLSTCEKTTGFYLILNYLPIQSDLEKKNVGHNTGLLFKENSISRAYEQLNYTNGIKK